MVRPATARRPPIRSVPAEYEKLRPFGDDVLREIMRMRAQLDALETFVSESPGSGGGAPEGAPYTTYAASGALTSERVWANGMNTTINLAVAGQISIDVQAGLTQEQIEDFIGTSLIVQGAGITCTYNDVANTLTIASTITQYTDEMVDDRVAALLVEGNGIDLTYVDGSNTLTVAVDETELDPTLMNIQLSDVFTTLYEVNYSTLANNTLVDGAETIDGLAYVAANMGELGTAAVQNGTGIRFVAATSNGGATTMTSASQLIPYIYVPISQIAGYNPAHDYIVEIYCPARILEANGEYVALGLWGVAGSPFAASTARMRAAKLVRNAADTADVMRSTQDATDSTGDVTVDSHDVIAIKITPQGLGQIYSGAWSAGWPASYTAHSVFPTSTTAANPMNTGDVRIFMGLGCANDASPTTSVTIERLRIRRAL